MVPVETPKSLDEFAVLISNVLGIGADEQARNENVAEIVSGFLADPLIHECVMQGVAFAIGMYLSQRWEVENGPTV